MLRPNDPRTSERYGMAAERLMRGPLDPAFANDACSVLFCFGRPLDGELASFFVKEAKDTGFDFAYPQLEPGREHLGPQAVSVFSERGGIVYTWLDSVLWAPIGDGPLLIMPRGISMCKGYDGRVPISNAQRPTHTLSAGVERARRRLRRAAATITEGELDRAAEAMERRLAA